MAPLVRKEVLLEGMVCSGCEATIEKSLLELDGVSEVTADYRHSRLLVGYYEECIPFDEIEQALEGLGYRIRNRAGLASENKLTPNQIVGLAIIIMVLYTIINNTLGFNVIPEIDRSMGYGILILMGLATSLHCISMCGGINLSQSIVYKLDDVGNNRLNRFKPGLLYNVGRIISYTLIGGIAGALGSAISFSSGTKGTISIAAGVFMIIMGINMLGIFPILRKITPGLPGKLGQIINRITNGQRPLYVGLLNGLMPCGPLQAMQLYALATGSFTAGALSMLVFGLGTVPLMFGLGAISSFLSSRYTRQLLKASAVLVFVLGIIMMNRGFNLWGHNAIATTRPSNHATILNGTQSVTTRLESGRYSPIVVQKGLPVKWTIEADPEDLNGCNNPLTIPAYNLQATLHPGNNVIEFTPVEEGDISYTCWMGMISSNIKVVDDIHKS